MRKQFKTNNTKPFYCPWQKPSTKASTKRCWRGWLTFFLLFFFKDVNGKKKYGSSRQARVHSLGKTQKQANTKIRGKRKRTQHNWCQNAARRCFKVHPSIFYQFFAGPHKHTNHCPLSHSAASQPNVQDSFNVVGSTGREAMQTRATGKELNPQPSSCEAAVLLFAPLLLYSSCCYTYPTLTTYNKRNVQVVVVDLSSGTAHNLARPTKRHMNWRKQKLLAGPRTLNIHRWFCSNRHQGGFCVFFFFPPLCADRRSLLIPTPHGCAPSFLPSLAAATLFV